MEPKCFLSLTETLPSLSGYLDPLQSFCLLYSELCRLSRGKQKNHPFEGGVSKWFFTKGMDSKYIGFAGHVFSIIPTNCHSVESSHRQYVKEWTQLCCNKTLSVKTKDRPCLAHRPVV